MTGTERRETVRLLPGEPGRRELRDVEIDDPTLAVLIRITLDAAAVPSAVESVCLVPRDGGPSLWTAAWPEAALELYVALAVAKVDDDGRCNVPRPARGPMSAVAPRRRAAVNAARHRSDDLGTPIDLGRVAAVHRAARVSTDRRERRAPVAAVARDLGVHRTDAARYVREARAVGVLEPAPPGDRYRS